MRTFYDVRFITFRSSPRELPLQGRLILKNKRKSLLWIPEDFYNKSNISGFVVAEASIYIRRPYLAKGFWDALKYYFKKEKQW